MGYFVPTCLAFILNSCGVYIFHEPSKPGCEPFVSCLIFLLAVFLLLWDIPLFPSSLRKLWKCGSYFFQFFIGAFVMEHIMNDFWFPLEARMMTFLQAVAQFEEDALKSRGWPNPGIFRFLKYHMATVTCSYTLSVFFLMAALHATRMLDFRLLKCGYGVFLEDLSYRTKRSFNRLTRLFRSPKSVKFHLKDSKPKRSCCSTDRLMKKYLLDDICDNDFCQPKHKKARF